MWISAFVMIDRFLEQQPAVCAALLCPQVSSTNICALSETDVTNAEEMVKATSTNIMLAESHHYVVRDLSIACTTLPTLVRHQLSKKKSNAVSEDLTKRYTGVLENNIAHTASALDPRFKTKRTLTAKHLDQLLFLHQPVVDDKVHFSTLI